jgi:hypothetical protein
MAYPVDIRSDIAILVEIFLMVGQDWVVSLNRNTKVMLP